MSLVFSVVVEIALITSENTLQAIAKRVETLTVKHPIMRDIEVSTL